MYTSCSPSFINFLFVYVPCYEIGPLFVPSTLRQLLEITTFEDLFSTKTVSYSNVVVSE